MAARWNPIAPAARTALLLGLGGAASLLAATCGDSDDAESTTTSAPPTTSADARASLEEADFLAAQQLATTFQVSGNRLDLFRPGRTYAAALERP